MCQLNTDPMRSQKGFIEVQGTVQWSVMPTYLLMIKFQLNHRLFFYHIPHNLFYNDHIPLFQCHRPSLTRGAPQTLSLERRRRYFRKCFQFKGILKGIYAFSRQTNSQPRKIRNIFEVNLTCEARGYPQPQIMWRREDGRSITANGHTKKGLQYKELKWEIPKNSGHFPIKKWSPFRTQTVLWY